MAERQPIKPEIASQKLVLRLPPALGDWTTYRPTRVLTKKVKTGLYGFDRLSKDEINRVLIIHYRFLQELLKRLKIDLNMGVELLTCQVEQVNYLNFLRTLNGPLLQGKISIEGIHEGIQIFFDLNLVNSIINYALGSQDLAPISRGLTEAENVTFSTAFSEYLPHYARFFSDIFPTPNFSAVSSPDATLDPSINTSSTFVSFSADVSINANPPGKITFGYLGGTLRNLLKAAKKKEELKPVDFSRLPAAALNEIIVPISIVLGTTYLSTADLDVLETGDVVSLDSVINSAVNLQVGNYLKLPVQPGIFKRKKAARVAAIGEEKGLLVTPPPLESPEEEKAPPSPAAEEAEIKEEPLEEGSLEEEFAKEEFPEEELTLDEEEFPEEEKNP